MKSENQFPQTFDLAIERLSELEAALARIESDHSLSRAECAVIAAEALEL